MGEREQFTVHQISQTVKKISGSRSLSNWWSATDQSGVLLGHLLRLLNELRIAALRLLRVALRPRRRRPRRFDLVLQRRHLALLLRRVHLGASFEPEKKRKGNKGKKATDKYHPLVPCAMWCRTNKYENITNENVHQDLFVSD